MEFLAAIQYMLVYVFEVRPQQDPTAKAFCVSSPLLGCTDTSSGFSSTSCFLVPRSPAFFVCLFLFCLSSGRLHSLQDEGSRNHPLMVDK